MQINPSLYQGEIWYSVEYAMETVHPTDVHDYVQAHHLYDADIVYDYETTKHQNVNTKELFTNHWLINNKHTNLDHN